MWFRVDDTFHSNPKTFAASPAALGLWVVAGSWSSGARTGGVIPRHALGRLLPGAEALADELVVAGLWETDQSGGYRFHDWNDYNPSAEESRAAKDKQATAGKLGNHRRWHLGRGVVDPSCPWCAEDRPADRVPDRSTDREGESGGESPRRRPDVERTPTGAGAAIGSDRVTAPETIGSAAAAAGDQHESDDAPDRVPDGRPESGANPPSRPDPSRPGTPVPPTSVGGVGEETPSADAHDAGTKPKRKTSTRGTRLPEPFEITDAMREWAAREAPSCGWTDHEEFLDHWRGASGSRATKVDWVATWRNWMRRNHQRRTGRGSSRSSAPRPVASTTSERVEGWLGLSNTQDTPDGAQMALDATEVQEVTGWSAA